jgi:hypothetical protein
MWGIRFSVIRAAIGYLGLCLATKGSSISFLLIVRLSNLHYRVTHPKDDQFSGIYRKVPVSATTHSSVRKRTDIVV